mmetsp:Transcript_40226/g.87084  ORF Transcript_40226/g.87084 Transcript_40226/m.87084 type:complete len:83 (-) Transcript_40226:1400-1648(-)
MNCSVCLSLQLIVMRKVSLQKNLPCKDLKFGSLLLAFGTTQISRVLTFTPCCSVLVHVELDSPDVMDSNFDHAEQFLARERW